MTLLALTNYVHAQGLATTQQSSTASVELPGEENKSIFKYRGIEASLGMRHFVLKSELPELNGLNVVEEGGSAAFVCGNNFSRIVLRLAGLYYSTSSTARTIDMLDMELNGHIYPLRALRIPSNRVDLYFLTGLSNQYLKFYGKYIDKSARAERKGTPGNEPYLGKVQNISANIGLGIEYSLENERDFIHLFVEGKTAFPLTTTAGIIPLKNTGLEDFYAINIGVRVGRKN